MGVGTLISVIDSSKKAARVRIKTYASKALSHLWAACGMAFIMVGFIFPLLGLYSYHAIPSLTGLIAGVGMFVSGGLYESRLLKWLGSIWWVGSIALSLTHGTVQGIILIGLVVVGYFFPGILLNRRYGKKGGQYASENA